MQTSVRFGIVYPSADRSDSADVPRDIISVVNNIEANASMYGQGTLATRPTSTAGSPGKTGRFYMATDQTPHILYYDYGTGWDSVGAIAAGAIGTAQLADDSITGGPAGAGVKIKQGTITHDNLVAGTIRGGAGQEIAAGSIVAASLAAALFPSQGAGGATEALRAIGAGAGQVVAGNDARLTNARVPATGYDPTAAGSAFPTVGLFTGYRYTLYALAYGPGGYTTCDFIYRPDLDGTYPWHSCGGGHIMTSISATAPNDGSYNYYTLNNYIAVPRGGWWEGFGYGAGNAPGGGGGANAKLIVGSTAYTGFSWGNQAHEGFAGCYAIVNAGGNVYMQGQSSPGGVVSYNGTVGARPIRVA